MKTLELQQMENVNGGAGNSDTVACSMVVYASSLPWVIGVGLAFTGPVGILASVGIGAFYAWGAAKIC